MTSPHSPPSHIPGSFTTDCQASGTTWNLMQWPWLKMLKSWQLHLGRPGRRSLRSPMPSSLDKARRKMARTSAMSETDLTDLTVKSCGWSRIYNKFIQILYRFYTVYTMYIIYSFSSCFVISSFDFRCVPPIIIFQKIQDHPDLCLHGIAVLSFQQPQTQIWHDLAICKTPRLPWNCQSVSVTAQEM